jgi:hypothetical protein
MDELASKANPILTMCLCLRPATPFCWWVWGHEQDGDPNGVKEGIYPYILTTPACLHGNNFSVKHSFNKTHEFIKEFENFIFMMKKINPRKFTIINGTNIEFLTTKGINGWSPHI